MIPIPSSSSLQLLLLTSPAYQTATNTTHLAVKKTIAHSSRKSRQSQEISATATGNIFRNRRSTAFLTQKILLFFLASAQVPASGLFKKTLIPTGKTCYIQYEWPF